MTNHTLTARSRRLHRLALSSSLLLVSSALVGALGVSTASADDTTPGADPSGTPSASTTPSDSPSDPSDDAPAPETPSTSPSPSPSASATPKTVAPKSSKDVGKTDGGAVYNPRDGVVFNYPYNRSTAYKDIIRSQVYKLVKAVPSGARLRIAMYSVNDDTLVNALIRAKQRGVSVQVIVNSHNVHGTPGHASSPSFIRLMHTLGTNRGNSSTYEKVSWARYCVHSCRGYHGNVHYKLILASTVKIAAGKVNTNVTMMGSPNLTMLAARGQWNHLNTWVDGIDDNQAPQSNVPTYKAYNQMFHEMLLDRPAKTEYKYFSPYYFTTQHKIGVPTWFFPKPGANTPGEDPSYTVLKNVKCTGLDPDPQFNNNGRTVIRIGAYAWYESRGRWMAQRIRQLWNEGCDVQIETAVMGNTVKSILYSPSGRGRIPIRQVGTYSKDGTVLTYDHAKWISVAGGAAGNQNSIKIYTGTQNWSNLALSSDDATQTYTYVKGQGDPFGVAQMYKDYYANFASIWKGPHSFAPSPKSYIPGDVGGPNATLGQGKYVNVEDN